MAIEILQANSSSLAAFSDFHTRLETGDNSWLNVLRENASNRFAELGFPSVKDEEWKYTNVAPIARTAFTPPVGRELTREALAGSLYPEAAQSQMVFVNGEVSTELSNLTALPAELVVLSFKDALADSRFSEMMREQLARNADYVVNAFTALNTALLGSGAFIYVPRNLQVTRPLHLLFLSESDEENTAAFPRVLVIAEEASQLTLIESYASPGEAAYLTNAVVELVVGDHARIEHYKVQRESKAAFHVANTAASLGRGSTYETTTITLGALLSRHDINVNLNAEGSECRVDGLYIVNDTQHADTHSVIDHRQPHCSSHQLYKGILDGKSRAVFNGKIFVRHGAQKTDAMQTNKNLLLSNEARVDTKPQLEILADDVKCAHGAAVGQIDEDELFYLETRGIHHDLARNLLTYGFAEEVIAKIKIDSIKEQLDEAVLKRLNTRLEA